LSGQLTSITPPPAPPKVVPAPAAPGHPLPDKPLFTLRPRGGWVRLNVRELWAYRELLYFLTLRDIQVRYKQTLLGVAWAVIQPLATMLLFWLFFGKLGGMKSDNIPYPLFAFAGLLPWLFFANAVTNSGNSLVGSSNLVTKVYFPRMIIPGAAVLAGLVDLAVGFGVLGVLFFGSFLTGELELPTWSGAWSAVILLPLLTVLLALAATGVGMFLSAVNVKYRDVRYALPFLIQLWLFATPVIYPASIAGRWSWVLAVNPLTGIVEGFRAALFARPVNLPALTLSTATTAAVCLFASYYFRRMETRFADIV
jgi:lipopolysaccharide transport system permease protein